MIFPRQAMLAVVLLPFAGAAQAGTLTVGPGQTFTTIASAIAASQDGDMINVLAGTYVNDFAEISTQVTLTAVGGRVIMRASGNIPNGKGILITDTDITITGFSFMNATVSDDDGANGAGVRYQGGTLVLNNCYFADNQNGLLSNPNSTGVILINGSEFYHNGAKSGPSAGFTHNLYVGAIATLDIEDSYFHGAHIGHEIKSRAATTIVRNSRIVDGPTGTSSYSIDMPNGGTGTIENNLIEQGSNGENPVIIAFGEEGAVDNSALSVSGNMVENDLQSGSSLFVNNASGGAATITNTSVYGLSSSQMLHGNGTVDLTTILLTAPLIADMHPWRMQSQQQPARARRAKP